MINSDIKGTMNMFLSKQHRILVEYSNTNSSKSTAKKKNRYCYMGSTEKSMHNR